MERLFKWGGASLALFGTGAGLLGWVQPIVGWIFVLAGLGALGVGVWPWVKRLDLTNLWQLKPEHWLDRANRQRARTLLPQLDIQCRHIINMETQKEEFGPYPYSGGRYGGAAIGGDMQWAEVRQRLKEIVSLGLCEVLPNGAYSWTRLGKAVAFELWRLQRSTSTPSTSHSEAHPDPESEEERPETR